MTHRRIVPAIVAFAALATAAAAQAPAGGPTVNQTVFATDAIENVTAVSQVFGRGQAVTAAIVAFAAPLAAGAAGPASFSVDGRTILSARVTDRPDPDAPAAAGRFVVLALDPADAGAAVFGPDLDKAAEVVVRQAAPLALAAGGSVAPDSQAVLGTRLVNEVVDDFRQGRFTDPETGLLLDYNLFTPAGYDPGKSYPLVVFLHDAGVTGTNPRRTLQQGLGAVAFASPADQARHPAFVLAPQYPVALANDAGQASDYVDITARLIEQVAADHAVDRNRIYLTGQSGGCMSSILLNVRFPDRFGGTLCVAGQWDPAVVAPLAKANFWAIVSQDDAKAYPGMTAIMQAVEAAGGRVTRGTLDAKAPPEATAAAVAAIRAAGGDGHVFFTSFTKGSVLPEGASSDNPGLGHVNTWVYAYGIPALRDWLFDQSRR